MVPAGVFEPATDTVVLFVEDSLNMPSRPRDRSSSNSSRESSSESVPRIGSSGGAVLLLSLRRRRMPGPTLPSRLLGAADEGLLRAKDLVARLESLRIKPPLLVGGSVMLGLLVMLCGKEWLLVFLFSTDSGSWNGPADMKSSISRPLKGSGEAWTELLFVMTTASGDMMGDVCLELEPTDDADAGCAWGCVPEGKSLVWTRAGRSGLGSDVCEVMVMVLGEDMTETGSVGVEAEVVEDMILCSMSHTQVSLRMSV